MMRARLINFFAEYLPRRCIKIAAYVLIRMGAIEEYQPCELQKVSTFFRPCVDRWQAIERCLLEDASSCLDVGCHTGYFANAMSKRGVFTIGIDKYAKNIIVATAQRTVPNLVFTAYTLDEQSVYKLPRTEITLCLSVFHHLVRYYGRERAERILRTLAQRCSRQFFFETGQSNETRAKWAPLMRFLEDGDDWARQFFVKECGFVGVKCIGLFDGYKTISKRKLFMAWR